VILYLWRGKGTSQGNESLYEVSGCHAPAFGYRASERAGARHHGSRYTAPAWRAADGGRPARAGRADRADRDRVLRRLAVGAAGGGAKPARRMDRGAGIQPDPVAGTGIVERAVLLPQPMRDGVAGGGDRQLVERGQWDCGGGSYRPAPAVGDAGAALRGDGGRGRGAAGTVVGALRQYFNFVGTFF
jgi:hypothetical protein